MVAIKAGHMLAFHESNYTAKNIPNKNAYIVISCDICFSTSDLFHLV